MCRASIAGLLLLLAGADASLGADGPEKKADSRIMIFDLPRFNGKDKPTFEEVQKALGDLPTVKVVALGEYGSAVPSGKWQLHKHIQLTFDPAKSDLGEIAKALGKLGGGKEKPVALAHISTSNTYGEKKQKSLDEQLAKVKGIKLKQSTGTYIALDEEGGAKYEEIRAAFKKAEVAVRWDE
jgi:hypothetical protein